jgi:hypothetical protein
VEDDLVGKAGPEAGHSREALVARHFRSAPAAEQERDLVLGEADLPAIGPEVVLELVAHDGEQISTDDSFSVYELRLDEF